MLLPENIIAKFYIKLFILLRENKKIFFKASVNAIYYDYFIFAAKG